MLHMHTVEEKSYMVFTTAVVWFDEQYSSVVLMQPVLGKFGLSASINWSIPSVNVANPPTTKTKANFGLFQTPKLVNSDESAAEVSRSIQNLSWEHGLELGLGLVIVMLRGLPLISTW